MRMHISHSSLQGPQRSLVTLEYQNPLRQGEYLREFAERRLSRGAILKSGVLTRDLRIIGAPFSVCNSKARLASSTFACLFKAAQFVCALRQLAANRTRVNHLRCFLIIADLRWQHLSGA